MHQEYLGIKIDTELDKNLDSFALETLKDRYFWKGEEYAQQAFARAAVYGATFKGVTDFNLAQRLYSYVSSLWFMFSTPILSNGGTTRGLPISCFLNYVGDSRTGLSAHYDENIWLASAGGGIGGYWGNVRSNGVGTSNGSSSTGSIPFMHVVDSQMLAFNQGVTRRGSYAAYLDINHPEIEEFISMRKTTGGDLHRKCLNLHNAVLITDEFVNAVEQDLEWRLIDPKSKVAVKVVSARDLWFLILNTRSETGEPYMVNIDRCNQYMPQSQKDLGLRIHQSNLCSEITLPTNEERTAVCCLSSVNLAHYNEWSKNDQFIPDMITMLDNVIENFLEDIVDTSLLGGYTANFKRFSGYIKEGKEGYAKAAYSAYRERSVGLGAMGFHSYLQSEGIPFESMFASSFNHVAFSHIKDKSLEASKSLAETRGEAPDISGTGRRNACLLAVAPNASSSIICGGTSPSIEPIRANVFTHKTLTSSYAVRNKNLEKLLKSKGLNKEERESVWKQIGQDKGSVSGIECLTEDEKELYKTAPEINQAWVIDHGVGRQDYICQSQSVNVFFSPPKASEPPEVHDAFLQYVSDVHLLGAKKLKSMYYFRGASARDAENVNIKIPRIDLTEGCLSCEG